MKKLFAFFVLLLLVVGGWYFVGRGKILAPAAKEDQPYVTRAERRDIDFSVEVSGDIAPVTQLDVKSEVSGKVKQIHVQPGQTVNRGDPLIDIDDSDLLTEKSAAVTEIEGAQLAVDKTRRNYERSKELFEGKLISREVYDNLEADLAIARNNLVKAERKLDLVEDRLKKTKIFSPTDGTVLQVPVTDGQVVVAAASVNSGTTLMTVANLTRLLVDTHVNQIDVSKIRLNQEVRLKGETVRDAALKATISFIAPVASVKNNVKGFAVQALIENPDQRLRPGMTVLMEIPVAQAQEAVSVPISAVFKDGTEDVVYVVNGDSTEKRPVVVGVSDLQYAEIKSGVKEGESILLVEPGKARKQS